MAMTAKEMFQYLTQDAGFDEATAKAVMAAADNEKVGKKAADFVQKREYDDLEKRAAALEKDAKQAKVYQDWYAQNYAKVQKLQADALVYQERFGSLEDPTPKQPAAAAGYTLEDVQKVVNETIQTTYAPRWSDLLTNTGAIVQKHIRAGRKSDIDFKKLAELAAEKGGDLMAAYDEYDRPEREVATQAQQEAEIKRRVDEELAKRQSQQFFPAGADGTSGGGGGGLSRNSAASEKKTYDRNAVIATAVTGKYDAGNPVH